MLQGVYTLLDLISFIKPVFKVLELLLKLIKLVPGPFDLILQLLQKLSLSFLLLCDCLLNLSFVSVQNCIDVFHGFFSDL